MKFYDLLKLSTRMFKARTSRTLLTILGMGIGISAILFLVSLGFGIQKALLETITTSDSLASLDVYSEEGEKDKINQELVEKIQSIENVIEVSPVYQTDAQVKIDELISNSTITVVNPSFLRLEGIKISAGSGIVDDIPNGVVISSAFARIFNQEADEIMGKSMKFSVFVAQPYQAENPRQRNISMRGENWELTFISPEQANDPNLAQKMLGQDEVGTDNHEEVEEQMVAVNIDKDFKVIGVIESEEALLFVNSKGVTDTITIPNYSRLKVKCKNSQEMETIRNSISAFGVSVSSLSDVVAQADQVFNIIRIILGLFGIIALIVSAIGMFNTMTVTLLERTEEIGIMKSIGASDNNILLMFIFESTIMGFLGGISGVILGVMGAKISNLGVNFIAQRLGGSAVSLFYFPLWFLFFIVLSATLVGIITGFVPAKRASSIDPLDALRYK